ncbi:MAG: hypothetical protein RLZZ450_142 [Pseudomonadota bacterium]|jgi:hypothetical protein
MGFLVMGEDEEGAVVAELPAYAVARALSLRQATHAHALELGTTALSVDGAPKAQVSGWSLDTRSISGV